MFGAMLDYSYFTGDSTYDDIIARGISDNTGPNSDFLVPAHRLDEGNDDQAFWAFTVLSAAEKNFTHPESGPSWLDISVNIWNNMAARWNTTKCGGGLTWQIYADNFNGLNYKNSASNGGLFLISARLAQLTGNQTYIDWASKIWDWSVAVGFIDKYYNVYDGTDSATNCSEINPLSFTYQNGIYLYGAASLANVTGDATWAAHAKGLVGSASAFFTPPAAHTNGIMWEHACEGVGTCTKDMKSFKGYLSRFMAASAIMQPALAKNISSYLRTSAAAAGKACSGANVDGAPTGDGTTCGQKWYVGGFDGSVGLGQEMCALETVQGLLVVDTILDPDVTTTPPASPTTATPTPTTSKKSSAPTTAVGKTYTMAGLVCALFVCRMT